MEPVDIQKVYEETIKRIIKEEDNDFNKLDKSDKIDFLEHLLRAQGFYIREGIKAGQKEIALAGLGTFLYNPLKKIAHDLFKKYKNILYDFEIKQLVKERFIDYFKKNAPPMKRTRGEVRIINLDLTKNKDA